ncbi:TatD family hydrolase [Desulfoprunum benzoelyticum]|uniref:TatD DNase family protein n=1 Tax=Desulfoprunum benzoelyticum TaxID=1506996 RepID=A0A840V336_9BACT|nr:TatD family hydrolase [Desulfoprunum benzoelyticum]MBB5348149.1 TatD DNase family protein [Desulfoprunum benzoelyticum]MBM9530241.1 TatD family hydrolase [Desulfoprunum benzoelyticum]
MNDMVGRHCLDSHLHLQDPRLAAIRNDVLARAAAAGVARMFCNATAEADWAEVLGLASISAAVIPFVGIHPWHAGTASAGWEKRLTMILETSRCGIGEIGLDRKCPVAMERQEEIFSRQLQLATRLKRPLSLHCLGCWGRLREILEHQAKIAALPPTMIHSFSGSSEIMQRLVRLGCWLSFSAGLTDPKRERLRRVFVATPLHRILLETDAPDQLPFALKTAATPPLNEPANILALYREAAELRQIDLENFIHRIWNNGEIYADSLLPR